MLAGLAPRRVAAGAAALLALAASGPRGALPSAAAQDSPPPENALAALDDAARGIVERSATSVVRVEGERTLQFRVVAASPGERAALEARLRAFGPRESAIAAGFLVDEEGLVLTTSAGVEGGARIRVTFAKGVARDGKLVGADPISGVALVRVEPVEGARALRLAEAAAQPGSLSLLLAPQEGDPPSLQLGFVSAARRAFGDYDAWLVSTVPVAPGQAGAPLLDVRGEVMGMAVAARSPAPFRARSAPAPSPGEPGPAAATLERLLERSAVADPPAPFSTFVPARELRRIESELRATGRVRRGMLGVRMLHGETVVREVPEGLPAAKAGVVGGDRILAVDGVPVESSEQVTGFIQRRAPGATVRLRLRSSRGGEWTDHDVEVVLAELPPPPADARQFFDGIAVAPRDSYDLSAARFQVAAAPGAEYLVVSGVSPGTPADRAGLRPGDWIVEIGGKPVLAQGDFAEAVKSVPADAEGVELLVYRAGEAERRRLVLR